MEPAHHPRRRRSDGERAWRGRIRRGPLRRGIEEGRKIEENIICSAISRVLSARDQWAEILALASRPEMQVIISNTTEVGIQLVEDDFRREPPVSFPGKLLAFLYARYQAFGGSRESGMTPSMQ